VTGRHDAVILAAGGSRRLGRPKQLLTRDGETLVGRVSRLVASTQPGKTIAIVGAYAEHLCGRLNGALPVFNPDWATGMASSLHLAADALAGRDGPVLVVVVDQLALDEVHLERLLREHDGIRIFQTRGKFLRVLLAVGVDRHFVTVKLLEPFRLAKRILVVV